MPLQHPQSCRIRGLLPALGFTSRVWWLLRLVPEILVNPDWPAVLLYPGGVPSAHYKHCCIPCQGGIYIDISIWFGCPSGGAMRNQWRVAWSPVFRSMPADNWGSSRPPKELTRTVVTLRTMAMAQMRCANPVAASGSRNSRAICRPICRVLEACLLVHDSL